MTPSAWAVAKAKELVRSFPTPPVQLIALALDEARAEGAERAALIAASGHGLGSHTRINEAIAAAIRADAEKP